jgi:2-polyprenyl-3-methyl-5-hydroxy-6-metoxy-1,4-benzoquinol methylase
MMNVSQIINYIKETGHNPYSDEKLSNSDIFYIDTLTDHYKTLSDEIESVIKDSNVNSVLELGSYMAVGSHLAREAGIKEITCSDMYDLPDDSLYKKWLKSKNINYQHFDLTKKPQDEFIKKYDCIIFQETLEHIPHNPARILLNVNQMLNDGGVLIFSVPNFYSLRSIINLLKFSHPYVKKEELLHIDSVTEKSGVHWIEFNSKLINNIVKFCNYKVLSHNKNNIKYGSLVKYRIKNLIKIIIPPVFDQHRFILQKEKDFATYLNTREKIVSEHEALNL